MCNIKGRKSSVHYFERIDNKITHFCNKLLIGEKYHFYLSIILTN
jgi:hypothetical protein